MGWKRSSESRKHTYSVVAASMPAFLAEESPPLGLSTTLMRGSRFSQRARTARDPSVEPSFTQMMSMSASDWSSSDPRLASRYFSTL